jgi:hypothetical protein
VDTGNFGLSLWLANLGGLAIYLSLIEHAVFIAVTPAMKVANATLLTCTEAACCTQFCMLIRKPHV